MAKRNFLVAQKRLKKIFFMIKKNYRAPNDQEKLFKIPKGLRKNSFRPKFSEIIFLGTKLAKKNYFWAENNFGSIISAQKTLFQAKFC